jgi:hypothetical protein
MERPNTIRVGPGNKYGICICSSLLQSGVNTQGKSEIPCPQSESRALNVRLIPYEPAPLEKPHPCSVFCALLLLGSVAHQGDTETMVHFP